MIEKTNEEEIEKLNLTLEAKESEIKSLTVRKYDNLFVRTQSSVMLIIRFNSLISTFYDHAVTQDFFVSLPILTYF